MHDVDCPYCGKGIEICHDDGFGLSEGDGPYEYECPECEKNFIFFTSISIDHTAMRADCLNGAPHKMKKSICAPDWLPDWQKCEVCGYEDRGKVQTIMDTKDIAIIAHEINRAYCSSMGDDSQAMWEFAPEWQQNSAINGVKFHLENVNATPEDSHNAWLKQKKAEGWKWGPLKNEERKEHPCFKHYSLLPVEQRAKDHIFSAVVQQLKRFLR